MTKQPSLPQKGGSYTRSANGGLSKKEGTKEAPIGSRKKPAAKPQSKEA